MKKGNLTSLKLNKKSISNFEASIYIGASGSCGVCPIEETQYSTCGTATAPFSYFETVCLPTDGDIPVDPKKM
ncbi:MAG: hypothetical protein AAF611_07350 [Bacteroidota bacterium]